MLPSPSRTWALISPAVWMFCMGSYLSHSSWRELPHPYFSPFPGASCVQSLTDVGCRGLNPLPSHGTILKGHCGFRASWVIGCGLCQDCFTAQVFPLSSFVCVTLSQVLFPNAFPNQHSVHAPVCQNLLPKEHGYKQPLLRQNTWFEIWKMRRSQLCARPGREERQKFLKQRGSFQISRKRKEANIATLPKFIQPDSSGIGIQTWACLTLKSVFLTHYELPQDNMGLCCVKYKYSILFVKH